MLPTKPLRDAGVYYLSTFANQAVPFFILPLITVYLNPEDFGFINTFTAFLTIFSSFFAGLQMTIHKLFYTESEACKRLMMGNLYLILMAGTLLSVPLFLAAAGSGLKIPIPRSYLLLIPLVSLFSVSQEFSKALFRISKRAVAFAVFTFSDMLINVSLTLLLVIAWSWHWRGRVWAIIAAAVFSGTVSFVFLTASGKLRLAVDRKMMKLILSVALPLIPSGLSVMLMRRSGVLFLDQSFGKGAAGLYGVAMNLATIILFLSVPLINVWTPHVYRHLSQAFGPEAVRGLYHRFILVALGLFMLTGIVSIGSGPMLRLMTTDAYSPALVYIPWLVFGFFFWALSAFLTPFLIHFDRQRQIAWLSVLAAAVNLLLNYLLIRMQGPLGAAVSFTMANALPAGLMFCTVRSVAKVKGMPRMGSLLRELRGILRGRSGTDGEEEKRR